MVRSLKRYVVKDFNSISDFKDRNQKAKTETFLSCVKEYVKQRFIDTALFEVAESKYGINLVDFELYLAMLISTAHFKSATSQKSKDTKSAKTYSTHVRAQNDYMNVIYRYSTKNL